MGISVVRDLNVRAVGTAVALGVLSVGILLFAGPTASAGTTSDAASVILPELTGTLGISGGAAVRIWNAYNSWYSTALTVALVPLGFGLWAGTIRLTFDRLVRQLGKKAARRAALAF